MKKTFLMLCLVLVSGFALSGCTTTNTSSNSVQSKQLEANQEKLIKNIPIPQIEDSAERKNVSDRAVRLNNQNLTSYVYLINYGKIMAFYSVKGKVSSLKSYMSPQEQIVNSRGIPCNRVYDESDTFTYSCGGDGYIVQAPDVDGTYGDNSDGIFFFTTDGVYVEWKGDYMMSDQPLKLTQQPELVREIK